MKQDYLPGLQKHIYKQCVVQLSESNCETSSKVQPHVLRIGVWNENI